MLLGLVRHFKVNIGQSKFLNSPQDFKAAMEYYDTAPVIFNHVQNSIDWDVCYCSSLPRAVTTAKEIYKGDIIITDLLREVPISPFTYKNILLPIFMWHIGARIAWFARHKSQPENIKGTLQRIQKFYDIIEKSDKKKILIVSHGYFIKFFTGFLRRKGYRGKTDVNPQNGKLYLYKYSK